MKTKIILSILVIFLSSLILQGQTIFPKKSYTANLENFTGTWEFVSYNEVFRITLKVGSENSDISNGLCLLGDYYYNKNGVELDNYSISSIPSVYSDATKKSVIIYASNGKFDPFYVNTQKLYVFFNDKRLKKWTGSGSIELISPTQIQWILKDEEGSYDNEEVISGFSVPTNIVLTKIGNINSTPEEL